VNAAALAARIEHAVLAPEATERAVAEQAQAAIRWGVRALVVKPCHVSLAARLLAGTGVKTVSVVGFPHGSSTIETKAQEARQAVACGADEIDMVLNIGALHERACGVIHQEIRAVVAAAEGRPVKVILETGYLDRNLIRLACRLAVRAGAAYVKTSTGFGPSGASKDDVSLMRRTVGRRAGVKAAGGIRSYADASALLGAGADLLGTSHTEEILGQTVRAAA